MTSLQKKVTALEEDNRRKEAEIKQMWTLVRSLSEGMMMMMMMMHFILFNNIILID